MINKTEKTENYLQKNKFLQSKGVFSFVQTFLFFLLLLNIILNDDFSIFD